MFIYSGGFWYLYQDQSQQERHKRDSQPRYREQARVKTPELREVRSECLQSAVRLTDLPADSLQPEIPSPRLLGPLTHRCTELKLGGVTSI